MGTARQSSRPGGFFLVFHQFGFVFILALELELLVLFEQELDGLFELRYAGLRAHSRDPLGPDPVFQVYLAIFRLDDQSPQWGDI